MRTGVGRVTIHDVMDGVNGRYTEDQFSYTGDPLDEDVWHFPAQSLDKFKRARVIDELGQPIVDGSTDANGWVYTQIAPIKDVDYGDGGNGDTIYEVYQYSVNGIDAWEDDFTDAHKYRRTAVVINGAQSEWSAAARISGEDGANGIQTNILTLYQVKEEKHNWTVGELVQTDETYLIINQTYVGYDAQTGINGWMLDVPAVLNGGEALYQIRIGVLSEAGQLEINVPADDWAAPVQVSAAGVAGEPGNHGSGSWIVQLSDVDDIPSSDSGKDTHLESLANRPAQAGDMITYISDGSVAEADAFTKQYLRDTSAWTEFVFRVDGSAIIEGTLAAKAIKAKDITGDQISATTTLVAGTVAASMAGMNGYDGGSHDTNPYKDIRFWSGGEFPKDAQGNIIVPYSVDNTGKLRATGVEVSGHITAETMTFVDPTQAKNDLGVYPYQTITQISGGGYTEDPTSGWGISSDGLAVFNDGVRLNNAALQGGVIHGARIVAEQTYLAVDASGDGGSEYYLGHDGDPVYAIFCQYQVDQAKQYFWTPKGQWVGKTTLITPAYDRHLPITDVRPRTTVVPAGSFFGEINTIFRSGSKIDYQFAFSLVDRDGAVIYRRTFYNPVWDTPSITYRPFTSVTYTDENGDEQTGGCDLGFKWTFNHVDGGHRPTMSSVASNFGWDGMPAVGGIKFELLVTNVSGSNLDGYLGGMTINNFEDVV